MISYDILVSELAEADVEAIFDNLLLRSPNAAVRCREGLEDAFASLAEMPKHCALAPDKKRVDPPMRQLIYRHGSTAYRILFSVFDAKEEDDAGIVRVLRVRHGAQQHLGLGMDQPDED